MAIRAAIRATARRCLCVAGAVVAAAWIGGCGGGGGSSETSSPAATSLTVSGTAAAGAALATTTIDIKCASGSASGSTQADGKFSVVVTGAALPCAIRASASNGLQLYSIASGSGAAAVANVTPATHLIVANLGVADPATYYAGFGASAAAAASSSAIAAAQAQVVALLKAAGIDLSGLGDLITAALTAHAGTTAGDAYDQALDNLANALTASGTTLMTLTNAAISANSRTVIALPPELLLRKAAPTCAGLRSATYRIVAPQPGTTVAAQTSTAAFDAANLTIARSDGSSGTWTPSAEACRFTDQGPGYSADVVVSGAGVLNGRYTRDNGATYRTFVGFPEQSHTVAELAGNWNLLALSRLGSAYVGNTGSAGIDAVGKFVGGTTCQNSATWAVDVCSTVPAGVLDVIPAIAPDSAGGFALVTSGVTTSRLFAYRAGSGDLMIVAVSNDGSYAFYTPDQGIVPFSLGDVVSNFNFGMNAQLVSLQANLVSTYTIAAVDSVARSWTRRQRVNTTTATWLITVFWDNPRRGYTHRPAGTTTSTDGTAVSFSEYVYMRLVGMGTAVGLYPAGRYVEVSTTMP